MRASVPSVAGPYSVPTRCAHCGKQVPEDAFFCAYCGTVVRAPPLPLPRLALNRRGLRLAGIGLLPAAVLAGGFWALAGQAFQMPMTQRLALGLLAGALAAGLGALLEGQILWPLSWRG